MIRKIYSTPDERMNENILNDLNDDNLVFRFIKPHRLFEIVTKRKLALVKTKKWDDPFENFLSNTVVVNYKGERIGFNLTNDFFGQCWTLVDECDGIWRNYSSLECGVRIQSTTLKLLDAIYDKGKQASKLSCFIGKVIYETDGEIKNKLGEWISQILMDHSGKEIAKMLLIKRKEFSYENEVRLLFSKSETNGAEIIEFDIEPLHFIDGIMFSPKIDPKDFKEYKECLVEYGFGEDKISKSTLYDPYSIEIPYDL